MADSSANYVSRTPLTNANGYPYHPARLVPEDGDMKKVWFVQYYVWDIGREQLMRRRVMKDEFRKIPSQKARLKFAAELISQINLKLKRGGFQETTPKPEATDRYTFWGYTFIDAIQFVLNYKRDIKKVDHSTVKEYHATLITVKDFLRHAKISESIKLRQVNVDFANRYFEYLRRDREVHGRKGLMDKTINMRVGMINSVYNTLMRQDDKLKVNPFAKLERLQTSSKKHGIYTNAQISSIKDALQKKDPQLVLFIQFMFYTLARPKELRLLKIGNIDLEGRKILIIAEDSKTSIEQHIGINEHFASIILESGLLNNPKDYYVFSAKGFPDQRPAGPNYFYRNIMPVIEDLGFKRINSNYTLYSFKHSGAVSLFMATKDPYLVQQQCRHQSLQQTNTYLRDLGLMYSFDKLNGWKGVL